MNMQLFTTLRTEKIFPAEQAYSLRKFYATQPWHLIIHKENVVVTLALHNITALWNDNILGGGQSGS